MATLRERLLIVEEMMRESAGQRLYDDALRVLETAVMTKAEKQR